jgi:starch synthase
MSKAVLLAVVFLAACSGAKPEEKVAPPDPIVPGSKLVVAVAPVPAPTPVEAGSGSATNEPVFDQNAHDECSKKAPANLEMSGRNEWIETCMAETAKAAPATAPGTAPTAEKPDAKAVDPKAPAKADAKATDPKAPAKLDTKVPVTKAAPSEKSTTPAEVKAAPAASAPVEKTN